MRNTTVQAFRNSLHKAGCSCVHVKHQACANGRIRYGSYIVSFVEPAGHKRICRILTLADMQRSLDAAPALK